MQDSFAMVWLYSRRRLCSVESSPENRGVLYSNIECCQRRFHEYGHFFQSLTGEEEEGIVWPYSVVVTALVYSCCQVEREKSYGWALIGMGRRLSSTEQQSAKKLFAGFITTMATTLLLHMFFGQDSESFCQLQIGRRLDIYSRTESQMNFHSDIFMQDRQ